MASLEVHIDRDKLVKVINDSDGTVQAVREKAEGINARANAMSAGFRTGIYHPNHKSPHVGGTQPAYATDTRKVRGKVVGLIHPNNYAAMKDNHLNNTLLKSI